MKLVFLLDSSRQVAVAWTLRAISRYSPDILKSHSSAVLPVAFLAMHQEISKGVFDGIHIELQIGNYFDPHPVAVKLTTSASQL